MFLSLKRAPVTAMLLVIITFVFGIEWLNGALRNDQTLVDMGAIIPHMMQEGQYWRAVAAMFLHAGVLHWAANSWALFQLGALYEVMFGSTRFAVTYFVTGIIASIASSLVAQGPAVGASGAILGILGAFFFSIKRSPIWRNDRMARSLLPQLVFWAGLNIVLGFQIRNIDNAAHIAGLLSGIILGFIPHRVRPPRPGDVVVDVAPHHYGSK
jgi:rhomboid protease GluP